MPITMSQAELEAIIQAGAAPWPKIQAKIVNLASGINDPVRNDLTSADVALIDAAYVAAMAQGGENEAATRARLKVHDYVYNKIYRSKRRAAYLGR